MADVDFHTKLLVDVFCHMLGTIDGTVTTACASEVNLHIGEATFLETGYMEIDKSIDTLKEGENLAIRFEEVYDRLVKSCEGFVLFVTTRVVRAAAVKHIASTIARLILRNSLLEREREDTNREMRFVIFLQVGVVLLQIGSHLLLLGFLRRPTLFRLSIEGNEHFTHIF